MFANGKILLNCPHQIELAVWALVPPFNADGNQEAEDEIYVQIPAP